MNTTDQNEINKEINKLRAYFEANPQKYSLDSLDTLQQDTDAKTVFKILGHFSDNLLASSIELEKAVEDQDAQSIWKIAHKLTSSAQLLGFTYFYTLSKELTKAIKNVENFDVKSQQVESYYKEVNSIYSNLRDFYPKLKQIF